MSSSGLTRMSKRMLDRINMADMREKVQSDVGQILGKVQPMLLSMRRV